MRLLQLHCYYVEYASNKPAFKGAEQISDEEKKAKKVNNALVVFTSVEVGDNEEVVAKAASDIRKHLGEVKAETIVIYPYAHLSSNLAKPGDAVLLLSKLLSQVQLFNPSAVRSPFGWYKTFELKCKGHPLAELSKTISVETLGALKAVKSSGSVEVIETQILSSKPTPAVETTISAESVSDNQTYKELMAFLDKNKAIYRLIDHPPEGRTEIVSPMRGNELSQAAHCIILQVVINNKEKKYVLAVVPGDAKVDLEAVKGLFNGSYVSFADKETAEKLSESVSGTILPFSFNPNLELIVDPRILSNTDELFFNAARLDRSLALKTRDYKRLAKPRLELIAAYTKAALADTVSQSLKQEASVKSEFFILTPDGEVVPIDKFDFKKHGNLKKFTDYEVKKVRVYSEEPPHIKIMKEQQLVYYEPASDSGNFRWLPKGLVVKKLLEKHATDIALNYGAVQVETPIMYDYDHPALKKYLNRFPARQYVVKSDDKDFFLRFSACFWQFLAAHDMVITYKNLPFKIYELTHYSFRREQSGELTGLKRLRAFSMPDMHTMCSCIEQAKIEFESQYKVCTEWNRELDISFETAFRAQADFFKENKKWYVSMARHINKPMLLELFKERYAYFVTKFEMNFIDNADKASGLSTVQIDVENSETFDLAYVDDKGKKQRLIILHTSIPGAIERVIYALLEKEAMKIKNNKTPMLPVWLSPTQVRIVPVSEKAEKYCEEVLNSLAKEGFRVDYDDRQETLPKKIRQAEHEWIPFTCVIGEREEKERKISVRTRSNGEQTSLTTLELIEKLEKETKDKPREKLSLSPRLSFRPKF